MSVVLLRRRRSSVTGVGISWRGRRVGISGFSLLELLVATVILLVVMAVLLQLTAGVGNIWKSGTGKVSAFQSARSAFATIDRVLGSAMLNTYSDYVDASGNYTTAANSSTFAPTRFLRASELHFISGSAAQLVPGGSSLSHPGHAVFFQSTLGESQATNLGALRRTLNSTGFYITYGDPDSSILPGWLRGLQGSNKRFRLVQVVEPSESLQIYRSTAEVGYDVDWLDFTNPPSSGSARPRERVLAEDISLLVMRPRLSPKDEEAMAGPLGATFNESTMRSLLSPNYQYDSRAWESGYGGSISPESRIELMRNQTPPIVDVAMVALDRRSLARLDSTEDPPEALRVPEELFQDSAKMEEDLATYGQQLTNAGVRFRIFRTSVELQGAKWSNN